MSPVLSPTPRTPSRPSRDYHSSSPNYFGLAVQSENLSIPSADSRYPNREPWSPSGTSVRSAAASSPQAVPVDSSPEYESYRKQSDYHKNLKKKATNTPQQASTPSERPAMPKHISSNARDQPLSPKARPPKVSLPKAETVGSVEETRPKHSTSGLYNPSEIYFRDRARQGSPAGIEQNGGTSLDDKPSKGPDRDHSRRSLPQKTVDPRAADIRHHRAETLPTNFSTEGPTMTTPQHVVNILESEGGDVLILDLRVSTQYASSRVQGALNLCIPTTLLKRSSYNVQRLVETFKEEHQKAQFEKWEHCKCIIVYDTSSSHLKEAQACVNILNKFLDDGWNGPTCIIRGGFHEFSQKFPNYIERGSRGVAPKHVPLANESLKQPATPSVAPVIGGCPMPSTSSAANPFFGNIRQNMDLIGGVGQMPVKRPASMTEDVEERLPKWLKIASDERDQGKIVSEKFLQIEKREQKRMQEALSGDVVYGAPNLESGNKVQVAGIEKGTKNRYNNIWPYEHTRVKLEGVANQGCDYVNASYIKPSMSNKQYIATQGPIPATFTDFWNMVWQRDIRVVVMLTAESEGGQVKAHNYWNGKRYGPLQLKHLSEHRASLEPSRIRKHRERLSMDRKRSSQQPSANSSSNSKQGESDGLALESPPSDQPHVIVRKFTLSHDNYPFERMREITQLQYSSWPDFGVPAHPAHILGLVEQCELVARSSRTSISSNVELPSDRPVLVHCSAGCGRTGTFCTVDSVIDILKRQQRHCSLEKQKRQTSPMDVDISHSSRDESFGQGSKRLGKTNDEGDDVDFMERDDVDLVEKTVEEFRLQRLSMVQSLRQYVLVYEAVLQWIASQ